jgi:hypothetical protein
MIQEVHDWRALKEELDSVRPRLFPLLENFFLSLPLERRNKLGVTVTEYGYGEKLSTDGWPFWPGSTEIKEHYLINEKFPLGVITKNACEVSEYTGRKTTQSMAPEAILVPGDFLGLFETVDYLTRVPNPPIPKWNISAGACSIYALKKLGTQQNTVKLERALRQHLSIADASDLLTQLRSLNVFKKACQHWRVRVVWFSKAWVETLRVHYSTGEANRLIEHITRRAWKNLARIRDKDPVPLQKALREATHAKGKRLEVVELAGTLVKRANDVLLGRQPCYVPVKINNELGPFANICDLILSHITTENWILCPQYLTGEHNAGYMKLDHVVPTLFDTRNGRGIKSKIIDMMGILASAGRNRIREKRYEEEIFSRMASLNKILFQTPDAAGFSGSRESKPSIYKMILESTAKAEDVSKEHFYKPPFNVMPSERCAFFRSSMRIERLQDHEPSSSDGHSR